MKKFLFYFILAGFFFLLLKPVDSYPFNDYQRISNLQTQNLGFQNLTLNLGSAKKKFLLLEPITTLLSVNNSTDSIITNCPSLNFSHGQVEIVVFHDGQKHKIEQLSYSIANIFTNNKGLKPGEQHQLKQQLNIGLAEAFPEPGSYQIQAILYSTDRKNYIESNLLNIDILQPTGINEEAYNYLVASSYNTNIFSGASFSDVMSEKATLENIADNFGNSIYGSYAAFLVGKICFAKNNMEHADKYFRQTIIDLDFPNFGEALSYLVQTNIKLKNLDSAQNYLELLKNKYPNSEFTFKSSFVYSQARALKSPQEKRD